MGYSVSVLEGTNQVTPPFASQPLHIIDPNPMEAPVTSEDLRRERAKLALSRLKRFARKISKAYRRAAESSDQKAILEVPKGKKSIRVVVKASDAPQATEKRHKTKAKAAKPHLSKLKLSILREKLKSLLLKYPEGIEMVIDALDSKREVALPEEAPEKVQEGLSLSPHETALLTEEQRDELFYALALVTHSTDPKEVNELMAAIVEEHADEPESGTVEGAHDVSEESKEELAPSPLSAFALLPTECKDMLKTLLASLMYYQKRGAVIAPLKTKNTKRLLIGLREAGRAVKNGKAKMVVVAGNLKLDDNSPVRKEVASIAQYAKENGIPAYRGLSKKWLGKAVNKPQVSCLAILSFEGGGGLERKIMQATETH